MKNKFLLLSIVLAICGTTTIFSTMISNEEKMIRIGLITTANSCVGIKYKYNGTTPEGFDNSGLAVYIYYKNSIELPRNVLSQYKMGSQINAKNARPGDLLFFAHNTDDRSDINHVGIYLGKDKFIHMPGEGGRVEIARLKKGSVYAKEFVGVCTYSKFFIIEESRQDKATKKSYSAKNSVNNQNDYGTTEGETTFSAEDM